MGKIYLLFFILFCCVFTSENAFSRSWWRKNVQISHNNVNNAVTLDFVFYDISNEKKVHSFMEQCEIEYSVDDKKYFKLISAQTKKQLNNDWMFMDVTSMKSDEIIVFPFAKVFDNIKFLSVMRKMGVARYVDGDNLIANASRNAYMTIKWTLPPSIKEIKKFRVTGVWEVYDKNEFSHIISEVYKVNIHNSKAKLMKNIPKELETEISDSIMVSKDDDGIIVTGAEVGKVIQIYNSMGVVVKTVVATDDAVNIKLQKNQMYLVKTGQASCKVQL